MYRFFNDPGHGWLEVPLKELQELGLVGKISAYSYRQGSNAYLEEDCDMTAFLTAKLGPPGSGEKWEQFLLRTEDVYSDYPSPVRGYTPYRVAGVCDLGEGWGAGHWGFSE